MPRLTQSSTVVSPKEAKKHSPALSTKIGMRFVSSLGWVIVPRVEQK
jgi:hypothetical protein